MRQYLRFEVQTKAPAGENKHDRQLQEQERNVDRYSGKHAEHIVVAERSNPDQVSHSVDEQSEQQKEKRPFASALFMRSLDFLMSNWLHLTDSFDYLRSVDDHGRTAKENC